MAYDQEYVLLQMYEDRLYRPATTPIKQDKPGLPLYQSRLLLCNPAYGVNQDGGMPLFGLDEAGLHTPSP
jgi:hypothetical protein